MMKKLLLMTVVAVVPVLACNAARDAGKADDVKAPVASTEEQGGGAGTNGDAEANPSKEARVKVKIRKQGSEYDLLVGPRGVGACRYSSDDCLTVVTWRWIGSKNDYDTITITAIGDRAACLSPSTVVLTETGPGGEQSASVNTDADECPHEKLAVFYDVTAEDTEDETRTLTKDPGVIIDN